MSNTFATLTIKFNIYKGYITGYDSESPKYDIILKNNDESDNELEKIIREKLSRLDSVEYFTYENEHQGFLDEAKKIVFELINLINNDKIIYDCIKFIITSYDIEAYRGNMRCDYKNYIDEIYIFNIVEESQDDELDEIININNIDSIKFDFDYKCYASCETTI